MMYLGLYRIRTAVSYDHEVIVSSELLGIEPESNEGLLRLRWNTFCEEENQKSEGFYDRLILEKLQRGERSVKYRGSTMGGFSSVDYKITIKEINEFDRHV